MVYSKYETLPEEGWATEHKLSYQLDMKDTNTLHHVFLTIRHADAYPYRNLFVFLTTSYPDGKKTTDTLECLLANDKGQWLGDGAGDIWDVKKLLKKNVRFPQSGHYTFTFEQGMRINPLPLIMDFGMIVEKAE